MEVVAEDDRVTRHRLTNDGGLMYLWRAMSVTMSKEVLQAMSIHQFPMKVEKFEIQRYEKPINAAELKKNCTAFSGLLFRRAGDPGIVVLWAEPKVNRTVYYEFRIDDIPYMEEMSNTVTPDGEVTTITRIWVKKGAGGIRCLPFAVEEIHDV